MAGPVNHVCTVAGINFYPSGPSSKTLLKEVRFELPQLKSLSSRELGVCRLIAKSTKG